MSALLAAGVLPFARGILSTVPYIEPTIEEIFWSGSAVAWVVLPFVAAVGSWRERRWGIWSLYPALLASSVWGSTVVPYWHKLPAPETRGLLLLAVNFSVFLIVAATDFLRASSERP